VQVSCAPAPAQVLWGPQPPLLTAQVSSVHVMPSPVKPMRHRHTAPDGEPAQIAFGSQPPLLVWQSVNTHCLPSPL